jgi:N-methylhydantoinase A/oxoprolinase/acetone carboxylase beta subunit
VQFAVDDVRDIEVFDRATLGAGSRLEQPCVVELEGATCLVPPGWRGEVDPSGMLVLCRS